MADEESEKESPIMMVSGDSNADGTPDISSAEAPTYLDGRPVDKEEAARVHAGLVSGKIKIEFHPEALADMEKAGISLDDLKKMLINATRKTMS